MNINNQSTNFCGVKISPKGLEKVLEGPECIKEKALQTVRNAIKSSENDFIINDDGIFFIKNAKYGTFRLNNPPKAKTNGNDVMCNIQDETGNVSDFKLSMKDSNSAKELARNFGIGTLVPEGTIALYNALEATSAYKKAIFNEFAKFM